MLHTLTEAGVEFLVFGSVASALHGHIRATRDLDIIIRRTGLIERKRARANPLDLADIAALEALDDD